MVKFGKEFRTYQIKQWKDYYINYKALKQEIKKIRANIDKSRTTNTTVISDIGHPSIKPLELVPDDSIVVETQDLHSLYKLRYGNELKNFIDLLEKEFRKSYIHFVSQEKELYKKVNGHCYGRTIYKDYNILNILREIKEINSTMRLAKQLNGFINDNVMALKKILKKFDKKYQRYFGIIAPKYILTHLTSQNSDLEYMLQFKLIDETTTICENNLNILLNLYKRLRGNNVNINNIENKINDSNANNESNNESKKVINLNNFDNNINNFKKKIYEYLDSIDELTYFKIQYREWFYYAKQNDRLVKNNPKIFENDIYNPVLSSTYHKDSLLEKCISSKNAFKEVERSQSPLSHSNNTNLILIYIQAALYNTMITNILPVISNYFESYNIEGLKDFKTTFLVPIILTYTSYLLPYTLFIYFDFSDNKNYMQISYIISYILIFISSFILIFVKEKEELRLQNYILILVSRVLLGFANNQMMNKKYITLYLPKFRLPKVSKNYLRAEIIGLILGPFISFILILISKSNIFGLEYAHFNCIGWYGLFISFFFGIIHYMFFIQPLSNDFIMVKDEGNITGNKYYQRSESEINRKQYIKEQNLIYRKTYNTMKKKKRESQKFNENDINNDDADNLIIKNVNKIDDDKEKNENEIEENIKINNDLEEKLINKDENNNNISVNSGNEENNSLDVSTGGNIALTAKQKNMINEIEKELEKRNEQCNFNDMNQIPTSINSIINKEKNSFGYVNQNLLLLFIMFFICSLVKTNLIFSFMYNIQEKYKTEDNNYLKLFCLLIFLLALFKILTIFFIFPFYQVNYKFKIFMLLSVSSIFLFNLPLLTINAQGDDDFTTFKKYIFIILNILLVFACNIVDICCSCYLSFILSPEWKIFGRRIGHLNYYFIVLGKICGGIICIFLEKNNKVNYWVLFGITLVFCAGNVILNLFTRILKIKGITRVIRKSALEINLDN